MRLNILIGILTFLLVSCSNEAPKQDDKMLTPPADSLIAGTPDSLLSSAITCPHCHHRKTERLPTEICLLKYSCDSCHAELFPKEGDCCVFCSYGDRKCPSMQ